MKKITLLLLTLIIAVACQSRMDVAGELKKANGKVYHLTAPYKNTEITITFSGNSFSGFAGVNNYFGNIEISESDAKSLTIADLAMRARGLSLYTQKY